jgi:hypothetical protein
MYEFKRAEGGRSLRLLRELDGARVLVKKKFCNSHTINASFLPQLIREHRRQFGAMPFPRYWPMDTLRAGRKF